MQQPDKKRVSENPSDQVVVKTAEDRKKRPIHWRDFDGDKVNHAVLSKGNFGYAGQRSYGDSHMPVLIECPEASVVFAPSVWDEEAEAKHGNPKFAKLDPNRKSDKWSMTLQFENQEFIRIMNEEFTAQLRDELYDSRVQWGGEQYRGLSSPMGLFDKVKWPIVKNEVTGAYELKITMRSERGVSQANAAWYSHIDKTKWDLKKKKIGKSTMVIPVIDFSDVFVGYETKAKCYAAGRMFYVTKWVPPRVIEPDEWELNN